MQFDTLLAERGAIDAPCQNVVVVDAVITHLLEEILNHLGHNMMRFRQIIVE